MRKKNIILIAIALVVVVICILAVVIGFGVSDSDDKDKKKPPVELADTQNEDDIDETEESSAQEYSDVETIPHEEIEETSTEKETTTEEETTVEEETITMEETTTAEDATSVVETTIIEETEEETTVVDTKLNRLSYEYMIIDGKSVYVEYNEKIVELFNCINAERRKMDKEELILDENISYIACARASQIAYENDFISDGLQYYELMNKMRISFTKTVENIASGHTEANSVVTGDNASWKTSTTHYDNMVSTQYTRMGVGVDYSDSLGYIWIAIFSN